MYTYENVNKGMAKVIEYLQSIENVWSETRTLKLYDVFFKADEMLEKYPLVKEKYKADDLFYWFCEREYLFFTEWMKGDFIKDERRYIGRTSSFYLTNLYDRSFECVLAELIDKTVNGFAYLDFDEEGKMEKVGWGSYSEEEILELAQDEMKYVASGEFLSDVRKAMSDAVQIANYIDGFKANQCEAFDEYLAFMNDELLDEIEREREREYRLNMATMPCYI